MRRSRALILEPVLQGAGVRGAGETGIWVGASLASRVRSQDQDGYKLSADCGLPVAGGRMGSLRCGAPFPSGVDHCLQKACWVDPGVGTRRQRMGGVHVRSDEGAGSEGAGPFLQTPLAVLYTRAREARLSGIIRRD